MRQHYVMNSVVVQRKEHNETARCHDVSGGVEEMQHDAMKPDFSSE